jgi:hypothetical protein
MQQILKNDINQKSNYEAMATVAIAVAIVIIVWATWPLCTIGLAAL